MSSELLLPAKDYNVALTALYSSADAIYLGYKEFGARAYATNFNLEEIENICNIAHVLNKKIYVVMNTNLKEDELEKAYSILNDLYLIGVDAIISTDLAVIDYIITNLPHMECHISTQVGISTLKDALYFEKLGAKRVVLAREVDFETIKNIQDNINIDLEVFIHGALCASISGKCYMSSMLSLRSGNRGRCAQNCRHQYKLYEDNQKVSDELYLLSMKDLNINYKVRDLRDLGVKSFKVEGRMKDKDYVYLVGSYYQNILNGKNNNNIDNIFHRNFTKGFLQSENRGKIIDPYNPSNVGAYIGNVKYEDKGFLYLDLKQKVNKGDRIRLKGDNDYQYITIDKYEMKNNLFRIPIDFKWNQNKEVILVKDYSLKNIDISSDLIPLDLQVFTKLGQELEVIINKKHHFKSSSKLVSSVNVSLTEDSILEQFKKLQDTPFYIRSSSFVLEDNLFISKSELNKIRRDFVVFLYDLARPKRELKQVNNDKKVLELVEPKEEIYATCYNDEQYEILTKLGIKTYYNNYLRTFKSRETNEDDILTDSYGDIDKYKGKNITTDYSFNIMNSASLYHLFNQGVTNVTLSYEMTKNELKDLYDSFVSQYHFEPNIDYIIYGHYSLMKLKCCPLASLGYCGKCQNHQYMIEDHKDKFYLLPYGCNHDLLNGLPLDLLDKVDELKPYVKRFRFDFTIETIEEIEEIITDFLNKKDNIKKSTKGYYKRPVL